MGVMPVLIGLMFYVLAAALAVTILTALGTATYVMFRWAFRIRDKHGRRSWLCAHGHHAWRTETIGEGRKLDDIVGTRVTPVTYRCQRCHGSRSEDVHGYVKVCTYYPEEA